MIWNAKRSVSLVCPTAALRLGALLACALATQDSLLAQQSNPQGQQIPSGGTVQIPIMRTQQAVEQGIAKTAQCPFPPLSAEDQAFLDQVLAVWEKRTAQVERFTCDFQRWQYNPSRYWDKNNPQSAYYSQAKGEIKYMHPDKGYYVVNKLEVIAQATPPVYREDPERPFGEFWICDGTWVYDRDRNSKKESRFELPPDQRGDAIENSPLPFLFGVKAQKLKERYWLRPVQSNEKTVWIEAWPKRPDDAGNYSRVQVVLSRQDILPSALIVFLPNWTAQQEHKEIYQFSNRQEPKESWVSKVFMQQFIPTKLPSGWTVDEYPYKTPASVAEVPGQGANR